MISVIIPALNESATIASVVRFARRSPGVTQVIVVDDGSIDGTAEQARAAGAEVMTSSLLGKGASMRDGLRRAVEPIVVYLDGDLRGLSDEAIPLLTGPLLRNEADFVKACFSRSGGRVTTLTARPLLSCFFPEVAHLDQPLGGIIAVRRDLLEQLTFESDYGVDVGLVIDAVMAGARLAEVDIGRIEHDSQPLDALRPMAFQVASVILDRAARHGRLRGSAVVSARVGDRLARAELHQAGKPVIVPWRRLALFDMDGTLLQGRVVVELARRCRKEAQLRRLLDSPTLPPEVRTRQIAALFRGVPYAVFEQVALEMPLHPGAAETVVELRRRGYCVGIVTDSYAVVAEIVRRRVFADFCVGHLLHFQHLSCRGRITMAPLMEHDGGCSVHRLCKLNVLRHLVGVEGPAADGLIAVGDSDNDVCLLQAAELSFAFQPKSDSAAKAARFVIHEDLRELLRLAEPVLPAHAAPADAPWADAPIVRQIA
ncbi:MAG: glycosyltransferase [Gemmatales bacterium]|nr:glycosyltransferase [Gemmatales bacterium]MDW8386748.1 glycosyltransferase [Gemmatales bacterium]